ncbi:EF-hand domain-containing protein [Pelagibius sp.]|uniref:EF-hand domain-containing protein n=1 Tax=Pelagibius sp. TaxID=1931238 RepID=UPI003B509A7E
MKKATKIAVAGAVVLALGAAGVVAKASDGWRGHGGPAQFGQQAYGGGHGFGGHGRRGGGMRMMLNYFDSNNDGAVSRAEIEQVRDNSFATFDTDNDQALSLAEFEGLWLDFMRERMVDGFQRFDADGDGRITLAEVNRPLDSAMRRMDRNEDGVIDRSDFRRGPWRDDDDYDEDDRS